MDFVARLCQPSTLRMLIWPEASSAQNNMAAVSADEVGKAQAALDHRRVARLRSLVTCEIDRQRDGKRLGIESPVASRHVFNTIGLRGEPLPE
jgi:hypothetical protein